jgi:hypothetical protein
MHVGGVFKAGLAFIWGDTRGWGVQYYTASEAISRSSRSLL